jgi:hypothetical protein
MESGRVAEFDSPKSLLNSKRGLFYELVRESPDAKELYSLAGLNNAKDNVDEG